MTVAANKYTKVSLVYKNISIRTNNSFIFIYNFLLLPKKDF